MSIRLLLILLMLINVTPAFAQSRVFAYISPEGKLQVSMRPLDRASRPFHKSGMDPPPLLGAASAMALPSHALKRPVSPISGLISAVASERGVSEELLHAVVHAESAYNPRAVSRAGAIGLMQVMPATGSRFGAKDLFDPAQNLRAGAGYLKWLLARYDNDVSLAVAAYNAGEGAVDKYGRKIPPYKETQRYVKKVMARLNGQAASVSVPVSMPSRTWSHDS